jgi:hypothetical protein
MIDHSIGFCFGNGKSRLKYDLNDFIGKFPTIGCNGLYREYEPDTLVIVDMPMIEEVEHSNYLGRVVCSSLDHTSLYEMERVSHRHWHGERLYKHFGWSAGPTALRILCEENPELDTVNLLGFDLYGTADGKVNNVYVDSRNYAKSTTGAIHPGSWIDQLFECFRMFPNIQFYRVGPLNDTVPPEWKVLDNIKFIDQIFI